MTKGILFMRSYYEAISLLDDGDRLKMYDAIVRYGLTGEEPELPPTLRALFILIKPNLDNSAKHYVAAAENGKKGGRPKNDGKNQSETEAKPKITETKPKITEAKPKLTEAKPKLTEAKPKITEAKPKITEAKPNQNQDKEKDKEKERDKERDMEIPSLTAPFLWARGEDGILRRTQNISPDTVHNRNIKPKSDSG